MDIEPAKRFKALPAHPNGVLFNLINLSTTGEVRGFPDTCLTGHYGMYQTCAEWCFIQ